MRHSLLVWNCAWPHIANCNTPSCLRSLEVSKAPRARTSIRLAANICRLALLAFWDERPDLIAAGIGSIGKFEHYFRVFRERVLPLVHSRERVRELLRPKSREERRSFYDNQWSNLRWRLMFRVFFSRQLMGLLGRDKEFFRYVKGNVSEKILKRTEYALTDLDPAANPYIQWILTGRHNGALPAALREENFERIRRNLDRLEWRCGSLEESLNGQEKKFNCFNLERYLRVHVASVLRAIIEADRVERALPARAWRIGICWRLATVRNRWLGCFGLSAI